MSYSVLLSQLEVITPGTSASVDLALAKALTCWCEHKNLEDTGCQSDTGFTCRDCGADSWGNTGPTKQKLHARVPAYTASIDAALELVRRFAPHGRAMVESDFVGWGWAMVQLTQSSRRVMFEGAHPAIALCGALLEALRSLESLAALSSASAPAGSVQE